MQVEEENRLLELELEEKTTATTSTNKRVQELLDKADTASLLGPVLCVR